MLSILQGILCAIEKLAAYIVDALVAALNGLLVAIAALVGLLISLLPAMPSQPSPPSGGVLGAVNWLFPLGAFIAGAVTLTALWTAYLVLRVALRWVKAL